jgi:hypothetical protein
MNTLIFQGLDTVTGYIKTVKTNKKMTNVPIEKPNQLRHSLFSLDKNVQLNKIYFLSKLLRRSLQSTKENIQHFKT